MSFDSLIYLSRGDMAALPIAAVETVDAIQDMARGQQDGRVHAAPKSAVKPDEDRFYMSTIAAADAPPYMAVKSLGLSARNAGRGLESIGSLITLFDGPTGHPVAVMDGDWITAVRTAGLSGVAARAMARPEAAVIAFIGCGVQARSHLDILAALFPLTEIRALSRGRTSRNALIADAEARGLRAAAADTPREALAGADLIVTTVPGGPGVKPFVDARDLAPGAFVAMVDLARSWLPDSLQAIERIIIDDATQEAAMTAPMVPSSRVTGDLGDLVSGRVMGRSDAAERNAFAFRGMAIGDLAVAVLAYEKARAAGLGQRLPR